MSNRASAVAFTITVALAAARLGAPSAAGPSAIVPHGVQAFTGPAGQPAHYKGVQGCTAYEEDKPSPAHEEAQDANQGAATRLLSKFFGLEGVSAAPLPEGVHYAIALAPDPRHTNLSLMFDREMSLLVQAAQDQGYDYNSSWLPWQKDDSPGLTHLGNRQYASELTEAREACPGVVLFRKRLETASPSPDGKAGAAMDAYTNGLVVLVVGEQATGGISEDQWENAIKWLGFHASEPQVLRVLGPTFTGSLVSLARDLAKIYPVSAASGFTKKFPNARVLSGSVTGCSAIQWFESQLPKPAAGHLDFGTFQENDSVHIYRFLQYLSAQGTQPSDTAILSEDETAYAATTANSADPCDFPYAEENRPVHLVYPRDISALRNAYEKQAVFDSSNSGLKEHQHAILRDEAAPDGTQDEITDTIPSSNGSVAAVDQEANLYGLVSFLRNHHTRYIVLRCTNPLDFLFLTRFFHRAYPEARVVTVGSDLLFRREIDTTEFRGVLALSSYPLLPRAQHWTRITEDRWEEQPHNHLVFQGDVAEGIYIAARYTLYDKALPNLAGQHDKNEFPLELERVLRTPDYAEPFWLASPWTPSAFADHPPTWLAAVGRDGYWPLAVLNGRQYGDVRLENESGEVDKSAAALPEKPAPKSTMVRLQPSDLDQRVSQVNGRTDPRKDGLEGSRKSQHYEMEPTYSDGKPTYAQGNLWTQWKFNNRLLLQRPLPWMICLVLAFALVCYQLFGLLFVQGGSSDGVLFIFRKAGSRSHAALIGMSCALAVMPLYELLGVGFLAPYASFAVEDYRLACWMLLIVGTLLFRLGIEKRFLGQDALYAFLAKAAFCASFWAFAVAYWYAFFCGVRVPNEVPLLYRMTHITDGVSPLLPILLLTFGFYLWNWQATAGNLNLTTGRPTLPKASLNASARPHFLRRPQRRISNRLGNKIVKFASPFCINRRITLVPFFGLGAACVCLWRLQAWPLLSLEGYRFTQVVNVILLMALVFTAAEAFRLYTTWVMLRKLLQALGRLRLRRTIARLRTIDANSIWSVSGNVHRVQYDLFTKQLDAARRLTRILSNDDRTSWLNDVCLYGEIFVEHVECAPNSSNVWAKEVERGATSRNMRQILSNAVAEVYNNFLDDAWKAETESLNLKYLPPKKKDEGKKDDAEPDPDVIPLSESPMVQAAEEFVAYHYIAFIQNIVARMRTMTLSMILLFITVCFAISFYPFVPRTETGVWLIVDLALIGVAVAYVYAGMERDQILSYITNTSPGRLGAEFYVKLAGFLAGPVIGILTTQFPAIGDTVLQWLQPGIDAIGH